MKKFIVLILILFICCTKTQILPNKEKEVSSRLLDRYNISNTAFSDSISTGTWYWVSNRNYLKIIDDSIIQRAYINKDSTTITKRVDK